MAVIATDSKRKSNLVKHEYEPSLAFCEEVLVANEAADATYKVGTVLGRALSGGTATAVAAAGNTGNGAMGAITVSGAAQIGVYTLRITLAAANAGNFNVISPTGALVGSGAVAVAFSQGGLAFTLADGATDFAVGDTIYISVSGTEKVKIQKATATDGSQIPFAVVVGDSYGVDHDFTVTASTDTKVLAIVRGPIILGKTELVLDASVDTDAEKNAVYAALVAKNILVNDVI